MKHWRGWVVTLLLLGIPAEVAANPRVGEGGEFGFPELPVVAQGNAEERKAQADRLLSEGAQFLQSDRFPEARDKFQKALVIYRELGNRLEEGLTLLGLGKVYNSFGQYPQAIENYEQALFIIREVGNRSGEGTTLNNLGGVYFNLGQYPKALEFYEQALFIVRKVGNRSGEGATLAGLGTVYYSLGQYLQAIENYEQALAIKREVGDLSGEGATLNGLGALYFRLGQYAEAERYYFDAMVVYESLRSPELGDEDKISLFDTQTFCYQCLQRTLIAQNKIETALEISERGRARAFVELMAQRLHGDSSEEFVPPAPPTLADIQQVAREQNATLVEYAVLDDEFLYIWVISPDGNIAFRSVNLAETTEEVALQELVNTARFSMGVRDRSIGIVPRDAIEIVPEEGYIATSTSRLQQLHQLLIEPISDLLPQTPAERVIFVPHSELFLVPFPVLQDVNGTQLIDKHTILTAPAIQVLQLVQRPNPPAPFPSREGGESPSPRRGGVGEGSDLLVVGNPVMPSISLNPGEPPVQLSSLPGAQTEAKQIAQLLGTEPLLGNAATEPAVTARMQTARIVHLATHGILDDAGGMGSSIALTPASRGNPPVVAPSFAPTDSDGFLTAQEILGLNLNADLVVLSACDTGRGKITGDGVVGLSRSLLTAGVSSLVVSLWQVPDAPTAQLMTRFYENLQQGLD
ncbi:MAG: CHAT domain-containing tetratricopeptide repeat protein, partial [Geitlerinemataceae cyanobacterium]